MKKQLLFLLMMFLPMMAWADDNGSCGDNVTYIYEEATQTLTISGTGAMQNYRYTNGNNYSTPWNSYKTTIVKVVVEEGVTSIGNYAFAGCSGLTSVTIPNSVTSIGNYAFFECSGLTTVNIFDIAAWCKITFAFAEFISNPLYYAHHLFLDGVEIKDLVIPNSVTSIGGSAFYGCTSLTSVTIPNSVTSIGGYAFSNCKNLMTVISKIQEPFNCSGAFSTETQRNGILYVPEGTMNLYTRFDGWREFLKIEELNGELKKYQLSFVVNNQELSSQELEFGAKITPPETDGKGNKIDWYKYPATMPEHDLVVYGMTLKGDANGDGVVDIADAVKIVNIVVGKE